MSPPAAALLLYEAPLSPFVEKVKIALREKKLPFERRIPAGIGVGVAEESLLAANPRSETPALVDGEVTVFDSSIILEYLEDRWPDPPLRAVSAAARARARMIEEVCDTHYEAINWGLYELVFFERAAGSPLATTLHERAARDIGCLHRWLECQIGDDPFFGGERFGMADLAVAPFVAGSSGLGVAPQPRSALARWFDAVRERPSVAQTFAESLADIHVLTGAAAARRAGILKRHYRDHRLEWLVRAGGLQVLHDGLATGDVRFTDLDVLARQRRLATR